MKLAYVSAALLAVVASAQAADMPASSAVDAAVVTTDWSGYFVGAQVGYSWRDLDNDWSIGPGPTISYSSEDDSFVGGLYYGRNWQFDQWVVGLDSSISFMNVDETFNQMFDLDVETKLLGLSRLKVGYAFDNVMLFAAGGLATTIFEVESSGGGASDDDDSFAFGWTVGAGVETKLSDNWSARLEYIYAHIEDDIELEPVDPQDIDLELDAHIVRAGIAYHF